MTKPVRSQIVNFEPVLVVAGVATLFQAVAAAIVDTMLISALSKLIYGEPRQDRDYTP